MPPRLPSRRRPPVLFAHRGARAHAPENTIEAFRLAQRLGASGLESDAWLTADGAAVLDHDGVVRSGLRRRRIADVRRDDLPAHVPTLDELYEACGTDFELSLDLKDSAVVDEVLAAARRHGAEDRLWLCHPDWKTVASWRERTTAARLVDSTSTRRMPDGLEAHVARIARAGVDALNLHHSDWSGGNIVMVHRFDLFALGWDAQFDRVIHELLDAGIDGVFGDHVDRLVESLERIEATGSTGASDSAPHT